MRTRKALLITMVVSLFAVGCAADDEPSTSSTDAETSPADAAADEMTDEATEPVDADWDAIVAAAREEGELTYYTISPPSVNDRIEAAFEAAYPEIDLDMVRIPGAELEPALEAERESGADGADVISSVNYPWIYDRMADGWFVEFAGPHMAAPEYAEEGYLIENQVLSVPLGLIVIAWNTSLFPEGVESYADLLDPRFADGVIGVPSAQYPIFADYWAWLEEENGDDFAQGLASQDPVLYASVVPLQESLAAGEVAIGAGVSASDVIKMKDEGAPVDYVVPDPAWAAPNMFYTVEWAENPNAAQVFLDFVASPEGQVALNVYGYSPLESIKDQTLGADSNVVLTDVDRMVQPGWAEEYYAGWRDLFGGE